MIKTLFQDKRILITGGTGSLGTVLTRRILSGCYGIPTKVIIFSRDETKQYHMSLDLAEFKDRLEFRIGDIRNYHAVAAALRDVHIVFNAAAMKQVPTCEYFPYEAVSTNIEGPENIVRCIQEQRLPVETVVAVSTDKACKPVNVMGMTKAIQERLFMGACVRCPATRFVGVRYGNVLASRGSVIPLFHDQILAGGPVTITIMEMTRFLLSLEQAVDTIVAAVDIGGSAEILVPRIKSSLIVNIAKALIGSRNIEIKETGIRPGEKIHEILVSEDEVYRSRSLADYHLIRSILQKSFEDTETLKGEYSSASCVMTYEETLEMLRKNRLMVEDVVQKEELLR